MASTGEEENVSQDSGRRTRSGRKVSAAPQPTVATRRSSKRQIHEQLTEYEAPEILHEEEQEPQTYDVDSDQHQSDIIQEMLAEAAQGVIIQHNEEVVSHDHDDDNEDDNEGDIHESIIYDEHQIVEEVIEEEVPQDIDDVNNCIIYEEQVVESDVVHHHLDEDVEMYAVINDEHDLEEQINTEVPVAYSVTSTGIDEKSSSFPFGTIEQSETSNDDAQNEEEEEEATDEQIKNTAGAVESSLLASLAGDNANSLPSVGGGEETADHKKEDFETKTVDSIQPNCENMDSDDSLSEPAIAEDLLNEHGGLDASNATIVNTEMVSEDELPLPTKPEINDAEEVSDDELPAPQRAELPADAEVISEDELPATTANDKKSPSPKRLSKDDKSNSSPHTADQLNTSRQQKRKADDADDVDNEKRTESDNESHQTSTDKPENPKMSDEQYNPMSPTSESNEAPPVEKKAKMEHATTETEHKEKKKEKDKEREKDKEKERKKLPDLDKYWRAVKDDPADFTGWTYLLQYVDNESDAEAARDAYDAFLSHYPYCYGYWRKYADYEKRKGIKANCNAVFERGLEAIPLSVDLWIHYLAHVKSNHADNEQYIRSQFERAIEAGGLEFRSDKLWDAYIKWENDNKRYPRVLQIYDRLLAIPTQGYSGHFDNFQDLINQHSIQSVVSCEELKKIRNELRESSSSRSVSSSNSRSRRRGSSKEKERDNKEKDEKKDEKEREHKDKDKEDKREETNLELLEGSINTTERESGEAETNEETIVSTESENENMNEKVDIVEKPEKPTQDELPDLSTLSEEEISSIKDKVISIRRKLHKNTVAAVTARWTFEEGIKRPYFHVKPLERCQLKNWKDYLDFEIEKGDRKRILVLFERCLIACALYDEFWLKMIRYLETQLNQPDIPAITSDVFRRACQIHHPDKPSLHLMWSAFEECQNNFDRAAEVLVNIEKKCSNLLQVAYRRINVERRRGDFTKCCELYEHYISTAKNKTIAGSLAIKYARFLNKISNDIDAGLRVLRQALEKDPANTRVALQMIDLTLQRSKVDEDEVVLIMDKFMARESIEPEQKVLFAQRKVEFLEDFGATAKGLVDAQRALQLALSKASEAKKKRESSPSRKSSAGMKESSSSSMAGASTQSAYNNGSAAANANYNYGSANSAYYGQQNSGAYQQQQQQQSYDGYYNNWQYGSSYSGYGGQQWSGYGNYY